MNREHKRSALGCFMAQQLEDVANLSKVESVERLVHEQDRLWREQSQRQQQPASVTFGQRMHSLVMNRRLGSKKDLRGDQVENSVHARYSRRSEPRADLGRRASDGESAHPQ